MEKNNIIQDAVDYIEDHVEDEITPLDVANNAGYSLYHFAREFSRYVGMPLKMFMLNVRLTYAIYDISRGLSITDASFKYGFSTHAGFYKAFKKMYGCNPKKYIELRHINQPDFSEVKGSIDMKLEKVTIKKIVNQFLTEDVQTVETVLKGGGYVCDKAWNINDRYTLKVSQNRINFDDMNNCLLVLSESYPNIQRPIAMANGEYVFEDSDLYFSLYHKVRGGFLSPEERYAENLDSISYQYGEAIGNLQHAMKSLNSSELLNEQDFLRVVRDWALPTTKKILEQYSVVINPSYLDSYVENFTDIFNKLPKQAIHRDANPSNIFFDEGKVSGFVDFELSEVNIRLFDPCYCATGILSEASDVKDGYVLWPKVLKGILEGYDKISKLTEEERLAIPFVVYGIQMIFIAYLERVKQQEALKRNIEMLVWILEHHDECFSMM